VIQLEEEWGDWLMSQKAMDAAINHYIESGSSLKVCVHMCLYVGVDVCVPYVRVRSWIARNEEVIVRKVHNKLGLQAHKTLCSL